MYETLIVPKIELGMKSSLSDATAFSEDFSAITDAEYLITVNIAQSISSLGPLKGGEQISTHLEESTKRFSSACVPLFKRRSFQDMASKKSIFRKPKNTKRNGRIDIAVFKLGSGISNIPICAIEVKGFNQSDGNITKDLCRNSEYFSLSCDTGNSLIEFTAFCSFFSFKKTTNKHEEAKNIDFAKTKLKNIMTNIQLPPGVEHLVNVFTVSSDLLNGEETQDEYDDISSRFHHHVGAIVIFRWKEQNANQSFKFDGSGYA